VSEKDPFVFIHKFDKELETSFIVFGILALYESCNKEIYNNTSLGRFVATFVTFTAVLIKLV